jgi:DNA-binding NarL/FixJ family response regulator/signal transduction histidine kinase
MPPLYLTPASVGFLTQVILSLAISAYVAWRLRQPGNRNLAARLLVGFFLFFSFFIIIIFLETTLVSSARPVALFLEYPTLAISLVFLMQFSYHFPSTLPRHKIEAFIALAISGLYALLEIIFAVYRFSQLANGQVFNRPIALSYPLVLGFLWVALVSLRQSLFTSNNDPVSTSLMQRLRLLWRPQGNTARATLALALVYLLLCLISLEDVLASMFLITPVLAQLLMNIGILFILFLFVIIYLNFLPENNSFMLKLVGTTLVISLMILGALGWVIAPVYASTFSPHLPGQQTLRFTPNAFNGYDMSIVASQFSQDWGDRLNISNSDSQAGNQSIDFPFVFFNQSFSTIFVGKNGVVGMERAMDYSSLQIGYGTTPAIYPLYSNLVPESGGVYASQASGNLILTWEVSNFYHPQERFSFQLALHPDGVFEISYDSLPADLPFFPDDKPEGSVWLIGAVPGNQSVSPQQVDLLASPLPMEGGPQGFVMDYYVAFRQYLHKILLPLLYLILADTLLIGLGLPLMINTTLVKPLKSLLAGVEKVEKGYLEVKMPVRFHDEIGSLTASFNAMTARLRGHMLELQEYVTRRTQELQAANDRLHTEIRERESAQAQIIEQQRKLAIAGEHERMGRDLHDGLGQVMGYLNMETQAVQTLLEQGQTDAAMTGLQHVSGVAQNAQARIRNFILGLRSQDTPHQSLFTTLDESLRALGSSLGIQAVLSIPADAPDPLFSPAVETQAAYIIGEALNNVKQHARAGRVEVLFSIAGEMAQIIISDDGQGFDSTAQAGSPGHFGLSLMRERAETASGRLEIRSTPGKGTQVLAFLPRLRSAAEGSPHGDAIQLQNMRLLLVDDSPLFLEGMRNLLLARGIKVVGLAHDGQEALEKARRLKPDVVVMDIEMPKMNGLEATRIIKTELPGVKIVILTVSEKEESLFEALRSGASGYLLKNLDADAFCRQLAGLARGESPLPPNMASLLVQEFSHGSVAASPSGRSSRGAGGLNARQWQILDQVAKGLTYKEVAEALSISEATVKYHMGQILERLGLKNREEAVTYARKLKAGI